MNAIVFEKTGGPEVLALADVPKPDVRPGMVLISHLESRASTGKLILMPS